MALKTSKFARKLTGATAVAAALSLLATPAAAVDLPKPTAAKAYDGEALNAERHRRRYRDNRIDAGDVIAGVLVLGAIAAISGAAQNNRDRSRDRDRDRYEERYPIPEDDAGYRPRDERYDSRGIGNAVDICVGEVERDQGRVGSVDAASRSADGWHVSGALESGAPFACSIGNDGRVSDVEVGAYEAGYDAPVDGQWNDDEYARAREDEGAPDFE